MQKKDIKNYIVNYKLEKYESILSKYNIYHFESSLLDKNKKVIYSYKPEATSKLFTEVFKKEGKDIYIYLQKRFILDCILTSLDQYFSHLYTLSIQEEFIVFISRVLKFCESEEGWSKYNEDVYWKDLGTACQIIYPVHSGIVEIYSGLGVRQGLSKNIYHSLNYMNMLMKLRGRRPFYQIHTHTPQIDKFNENGWKKSYLQVSEMLRKHENIKGVLRCSWFFDPCLKDISPHLMYLQNLPLKHGAKRFYVGPDKSRNALYNSKKRKKMYEDGKYIPKLYLLVWPRKEIIKWVTTYSNAE
ncbi:MAG: hypothetical protein ACOCUV_01315 [bacterium]